ncbi:hypothetical protein BC826DRAFT_969272 [Russula brevipes]|nr:hypothetical protein BC826DRAFT_969272 [Russula brevipes]
MMFRSFALFGGLALLSSAAAHQGHHAVYKVQVSNSTGALVFEPPRINATEGDIVEFTFVINNHTVTESESIYDACTPKYHGIDSGFQPVPKGATADYLPVWNLTLTSVSFSPFRCCGHASQPLRQGHGFAINAGDDAFAEFQKNALAVGAKLNYAPVYPSYARAKRELQ